jgi:solute carrier family 25 protein 16
LFFLDFFKFFTTLMAIAPSNPTPVTPSSSDIPVTKQDHSWSYFIKSSMAGGISGCFAKTVVAPLDRVKILFQGYRPDYIRHAGTP